MPAQLLSPAGLTAALATAPEWRHEGTEIRRSVKFPTFLKGIEAVNRVALAAEKADHHPDIDIRHRRVTFALTTHSSGGLTERDFALARQIDGLLLD